MYYTPQRMHRFSPNTPPTCPRCRSVNGDLIHMFWKCTHLNSFWKNIYKYTSEILQKDILPDPRISVLGDVEMLKEFCKDERKSILLITTAAKKCILTKWKDNQPPTLKQWWRELLSYSTSEKIMYNVKGKPMKFDRVWGRIINNIRNIEGKL